MKSSVVRARVDDLLKAQASAVLASCGLEMSDALRLFLSQVVNRGGLPFPVRQVALHGPAKRLKQVKRRSQARDRALVAQGGADLGDEPIPRWSWPQIITTAHDLKHCAPRMAHQIRAQKFRPLIADSARRGSFTTARRAGIDGKVCNWRRWRARVPIDHRASSPHFSWCKKVRVLPANAPSPCNSPQHQSLLFFESKVS